MNFKAINIYFIWSNFFMPPVIYFMMTHYGFGVTDEIVNVISTFAIKIRFETSTLAYTYSNSVALDHMRMFANLLAATMLWCGGIILARIFWFSKEKYYEPTFFAQMPDKSRDSRRIKFFLSMCFILSVFCFATPGPFPRGGRINIYFTTPGLTDCIWNWLLLSSLFVLIDGWVVYMEIPKIIKSRITLVSRN
jgi:hypothetical protein